MHCCLVCLYMHQQPTLVGTSRKSFCTTKRALQKQRICNSQSLNCTCGLQVHKWCSVFASAAAIGVCGSLLQQTGFATAGVELTRRLRVLLLSTILRQVCSGTSSGAWSE